MKPTGLWWGRLAMAGLCLATVGCGGSDVPDPASDSRAAVETSSRVVDGAGAAASAPAPEPAPAAPSAPAESQPKPAAVVAAAPSPTPAPAAAEPEPPAAKVASVEPTPAAGATDAPAGTPKGDTSGTDEMMRMAAAPAAAPGTDAPAPATGATAAPAPAPAASPAPAPAASGGGAAQGGMAVGLEVPAAPGSGSRRSGDAMDGRSGGPGREGGGPGRVGGGPGGMVANEGGGAGFGASATLGGGGTDADPGPGAFRLPGSAVQAFLIALKAKNKDRLSQATARRAATEAVEKHRKIFAAILEQSISDEELDDMAKSLEGYQIQNILPAKSTGQIGVLIGKMNNQDQLQRTVQVRKEKEGWKVLDFGGVIEYKATGVRRPGRR